MNNLKLRTAAKNFSINWKARRLDPKSKDEEIMHIIPNNFNDN